MSWNLIAIKKLRLAEVDFNAFKIIYNLIEIFVMNPILSDLAILYRLGL